MIWSDVICDVRYVMLCYVHFNQNFWAQKISLTRLLLIQLQRLRHFQFVEEVQQTQQQQRFFQRFFNVGELGAWSFLCHFFFFTWCGEGAICDGGGRSQQMSSSKRQLANGCLQTLGPLRQPPLRSGQPGRLVTGLGEERTSDAQDAIEMDRNGSFISKRLPQSE